MARSLAALTDSVYTQVEAGYIHDDSRLPRELVRDKVLRISWAALGAYYSKMIGQLPDVLYQRCCIPVTCTPICDSPVVRTIGQLPGIMGTLNRKEIRYVGTVEGRAFNRTDTRVAWENYQPFAGKATPSYRVTGNEVEIINAPIGLEVVEVEGIFADPTICKLCLTDEEFIIPLAPEMLDDVEVKAIKELTQWWKQFRPEKKNDAVPNT